MIDINVTPLRDGFAASQKSELYFLVTCGSTVQQLDTEKRQNLDLSFVVDRSGSMDGKPLDCIKHAIAHLVDQLKPQDKISVVQYDHDAQTIFPRNNLKNRDNLRHSLATMYARGATNILNGWYKGFEEFGRVDSRDSIKRILLFSDGMANRGATNPSEFAPFIKEGLKLGITTSTYGIAHHFNEELMTFVSEIGAGRSVYAETADDLINPMIEELDLLKSLVAKELAARVRSSNGVTIEVLNDYSQNSNGDYVLSDLAIGGQVWMLIKVSVDNLKDCIRVKDKIKLFDLNLSYWNVLTSNQEAKTQSAWIKLVRSEEFANLSKNEMVQQRLNEVLVSYEQRKAYEAAKREDWDSVNNSLKIMEDLSRADPWLSQSTENLRAQHSKGNRAGFMKEAMYKSNHLRKRMVPQYPKAESSNAFFSDDQDNHLPSYLRRKTQEGKR